MDLLGHLAPRMASMNDWRFERKFTLSLSELMSAENVLLSHTAGFSTAYPARVVTNCHFDTPAFAFYEAHRAGHMRGSKWRVRQYDQTGPWQLEQKYKNGFIGTKGYYPEKVQEALSAWKSGDSLNTNHNI